METFFFFKRSGKIAQHINLRCYWPFQDQVGNDGFSNDVKMYKHSQYIWDMTDLSCTFWLSSTWQGSLWWSGVIFFWRTGNSLHFWLVGLSSWILIWDLTFEQIVWITSCESVTKNIWHTHSRTLKPSLRIPLSFVGLPCSQGHLPYPISVETAYTNFLERVRLLYSLRTCHRCTCSKL